MSQNREHDTDEQADAARAREGEGEGGQGGQAPPEPQPNIRLRHLRTERVPTGNKVPVDPGDETKGFVDETRDEPVFAAPAPEGKLNIGMHPPILMPSAERQRAGWYEPAAGLIIQQFPDRYVRVVQKEGGK